MEEAPAEEEGGGVPGWFRLDSDGLGLQLWAGATHSIGSLDIASDIYVLDNFASGGSFGEFDIGPAFSLADGAVALTPMIGLGFHWQAKKMTTVIAPQLFTIVSVGDLYIENWIQGFLLSPTNEGAGDSLYTRLFVLFQIIPDMAIGPQVEATIALNDAAKTVDDMGEPDKALTSLPVGGRINLNYGENNTLGLFLGIETVDEAKGQPNDRALAGRFTFVRAW